MNAAQRVREGGSISGNAADGRTSDLLAAASRTAADCLADGRPVVIHGRRCKARTRLSGIRCRLAVFGPFKRGRSTFINALPGGSALPPAVPPPKTAATSIAWEPTPLPRVSRQSSRAAGKVRPPDILHSFVTEAANPDAVRGADPTGDRRPPR